MLRPFVMSLAAVALASAPAAAGDERYAGHFALAGKQIPLPEGEWVLAGQGGTAPFESAVLVQLSGGDVRAFVIATTNTEPAEAGWGLTRDCSRSDFDFAAIQYVSAMDGACRFVNRVTTSARPDSSPAWIAAAETAARKDWTLPSLWLMAGVRITDRRDVVDVRYHFLGGVPEIAAAWTEQALAKAERGLRRRLEGDGPLAMPLLSVASAPYRVSPPVVKGDDAGTPAWGVGLMKMVSWRIVGTAADVGLAYAFTGDPLLSGGLAATGAVVNSLLYFGHELAWDQARKDAPALLEFAGAGSIAND
ncbi:MAG TPA: DUF2061 domain-containing protein [Azospirillum sp.]|nr:DUF2061 domain-containing protein [Azospirillum sp.]